MMVMIKSLARAKFGAPILSELSTMNARSRGAHLHSEDAGNMHIKTFTRDHANHGVFEITTTMTVLD